MTLASHIRTVGLVMLVGLSSIYSGFALSVLWGWFVVPTFGAPQLALLPAIWINLTMGFLTSNPSYKKRGPESFSELVLWRIAVHAMNASVALAVGWVVHLFM
ncbi:MAG: hypothetical protein HYY50_05555 [Candidatus Kerfeldbacteria bacterium]|nr:hypothetical protein [Candidatus Kerfeldbacteria bacterium]